MVVSPVKTQSGSDTRQWWPALVTLPEEMANVEGRGKAEATVDREGLAADPSSVLGAEKSHHLGNVVWRPNPLHGSVGHDVLFEEAIHFFSKHVRRVRIHKPWINAVNTDTPRGEFAGQVGSEDFEGTLGGSQSPVQGDIAPGVDP